MYLEQFRTKSLLLDKNEMKNILGGEAVGWTITCSGGETGISYPCEDAACNLPMAQAATFCNGATGSGSFTSTQVNMQ